MAHRLRVKPYSSHSASKRRGSRDIHMHHNWKDVDVVRGKINDPIIVKDLIL